MSYLGIDVGGTKVALRIESAEAPEAGEGVFRWPGPGDIARDMAALAAGIAGLRERRPGPIAAAGVAMPATLDRAGRVVAWPNRPYWQGLDLYGELRALLPGTSISSADDGDLAAMAEADSAGVRNLVYLGVGTGIGGGVVLDGRLCPGPDRGSCEVGHMVVDRAGRLCDCGRRGCVQSVASGPATLRRAAELRGGDVTFAELRAACEDGAGWALEAMEESAAALAAAVTGLSELMHPELAVVGGGFATALPGYVPAVARQVDRLVRPGGPRVPVRRAMLGGLSSLHGAVLLARGR
ncbi:ROK family protein [Streptomyces sp. H10-C2]|uniref:ROK family protein n=1 Tax=unclassified Streptomyces TaxID=2593676 RepID=UPI0024B91790|nr:MULTISPECIES: ROK family protein [unclassified Streptomyces]MDJ0346721.1 ROK family protein [Streptomyces sp. PH10-H1]MDJ0375161.1 ROK family protein [Streptomyces sp. H10-C2]